MTTELDPNHHPPDGVDRDRDDDDERSTFPITKILASIAVLALAGGVFTISSLALFTDQETAGGNAFATGTIDLTATPATAIITASGMVPGDQTTSELDVANSGTLEFRYALQSATDEDNLATQLVMTVKSGVTTCSNAGWGADGTVVYSGILGSTATIAVFGDPTQGADTGDRTLAAGANERLCFNVTLPLAAPNTVQGSSSTATLTFDAEQTSNNP